MHLLNTYGDKIFEYARQFFDMVSIEDANLPLDCKNAERLDLWIRSGRVGNLEYMKRPIDRTDLKTIMPTVKTVIVVAKLYDKIQKKPGVARFAQGEDYHISMKEKLYTIAKFIKEIDPTISARAVVDSAPALEKAWAVRSGFGWVGRNSLIVNESLGSFFNIGLLLVDKTFKAYSHKKKTVKDMCADCRLCVDACPMGAICDDRMIDVRKCISNLTVEKSRRGVSVPAIHGWTYGCDECQICCPFNV